MSERLHLKKKQELVQRQANEALGSSLEQAMNKLSQNEFIYLTDILNSPNLLREFQDHEKKKVLEKQAHSAKFQLRDNML